MHPEKREEWNFRRIENIKELEKNIFPKDRNKTFFQNTLEGGDDSVQKGQLKHKAVQTYRHSRVPFRQERNGHCTMETSSPRSQVKLGGRGQNPR